MESAQNLTDLKPDITCQKAKYHSTIDIIYFGSKSEKKTSTQHRAVQDRLRAKPAVAKQIMTV